MENKESVIILQDGSEKKGNGWAWKKFGKAIKNYKWWIVGSTLVGGVLGLLGNHLVLNKETQKLSARYLYNIAVDTYGTDSTERFVDGSVFNYASVISAQNLKSVRDSNEKYAKINVDKLVKENAFTVARVINYQLDENDKPIIDTKSVEYTITIKAKYFKDIEVGKSFVEDVISSPVAASTNAVNSYSLPSYLDSTNQAGFESQAKNMVKQYRSIIDTYEKLQKKFGGSAGGNEAGESINKLHIGFKNEFTIDSAAASDALLGSLYANSYVDYEVGHEDEAIAKIEQLGKSNVQIYNNRLSELNALKDRLNSLTALQIIQTVEDDTEYVKTIVELSEKIATAQDEIDDIVKTLNYCGYYKNSEGQFVFDDTDETNAIYHLQHATTAWKEGCAAFKASLAEWNTKFQAATEKASQIFRFVYNNYQNSMTLLDSGSVQVKGGITIAVGLLGGLILGFAVSTFVCTTIEIGKKEEESEAK